jgi:hypothetical protein
MYVNVGRLKAKERYTLTATVSVRKQRENMTLYGRSAERRNWQHTSPPLIILDATQYVVLYMKKRWMLGR